MEGDDFSVLASRPIDSGATAVGLASAQAVSACSDVSTARCLVYGCRTAASVPMVKVAKPARARAARLVRMRAASESGAGRASSPCSRRHLARHHNPHGRHADRCHVARLVRGEEKSVPRLACPDQALVRVAQQRLIHTVRWHDHHRHRPASLQAARDGLQGGGAQAARGVHKGDVCSVISAVPQTEPRPRGRPMTL